MNKANISVDAATKSEALLMDRKNVRSFYVT